MKTLIRLFLEEQSDWDLQYLLSCSYYLIVITVNCLSSGIEVLWRQIAETFTPWIQTYFIKGGMHVPWIESDKDTATIMVKALCDIVYYAHSKTAGKRVLAVKVILGQ